MTTKNEGPKIKNLSNVLSQIQEENKLGLVHTKKDIEEVILQLDDLINSLFNVNIDIEKKMDEILPQDKKQKIMEIVKRNKIDIKDTLQFQNFLKELQQRVENIPVIMLHFAFNPKEEILRSVLNWFLENLKKEVVLDIEVDQNLIGGAVVVYNGIYKDYSLRKKFEDKIKMGEIKLGLDSS